MLAAAADPARDISVTGSTSLLLRPAATGNPAIFVRISSREGNGDADGLDFAPGSDFAFFGSLNSVGTSEASSTIPRGAMIPKSPNCPTRGSLRTRQITEAMILEKQL